MKNKAISGAKDLFRPLFRALLFLERLAHLSNIIFSCLFLLPESRPRRFRLFFERAGGAFLKLGQILAMRQDFLPIAYTEELIGLLSAVPEESWAEMAKVFEEEIGERPETFFATIDTRPVASASIGQVYRAVMKDGSIVAVKIARPGVEEIFENDYILAGFFAELIGIFTFMKALPVQDVVAEFISATRAELDFRNEAKNAAILNKNSGRHPNVVIPKPFLEHARRRVLIMEFLTDIITAEKALRGLSRRGDDYRKELQSRKIELAEVSYCFVVDGARQYFLDGFFHADPHPGNVFFLPGNKVGFFDFGLIGYASKQRELGAQILYCLAHRDIYGMSKHFLTFARESFAKELDLYRKTGKALDDRYDAALAKIEEIMIDNFALDLEDILTPWYEAIDRESPAPLSAEELHGKSASIMFSKIIAMSGRYDIILPKEMVLFLRSISIADMVALRLHPGFDMMKALQRFFHEYPLATLEEMIVSERADDVFAKDDGITTLADQSFEGLEELRLRDQEQSQAARERLAEIVAYYAETYPEVHALMKD